MQNSYYPRLWRLEYKYYEKWAINRPRMNAMALVIVENATLWAPDGLIGTELLESHSPESLIQAKLLELLLLMVWQVLDF